LNYELNDDEMIMSVVIRLFSK